MIGIDLIRNHRIFQLYHAIIYWESKSMDSYNKLTNEIPCHGVSV
jgi:hypothetical protein